MIINEHYIFELIRRGEGISVEFKNCRDQYIRNLSETVCAFLNRYGGTILLGVQDTGDIAGIDPDAVMQIKKDFVTAIDTSQKIYPPAYLSVDEMNVSGKIILRIYVPESSLVHRCNGRIYDRNENGDIDITEHTNHVASLYRRKQATFTENTIYPLIDIGELRHDLIDRSRKQARVNMQNHPWRESDDLQLLQSAQLYQTDPLTQKSGLTLAGILMFGTDQLIQSVVPAFQTDLILRKVNLDRYDDRDQVRTNLIDSYNRILDFVQKHLPDPFYLDGVERVSLRDIIFREVASNMLIHREFTDATPARLIIEYGQVRTENANRPHGFGLLNPAAAVPYPKNPVICSFFRAIQMADELGSGMRKLMRYGKAYGGADPEMIEGELFRIIVKVPEFSAQTLKSTHPEQAAASGDISARPESRPELELNLLHKQELRQESELIVRPELCAGLGPESIGRRVLLALRNKTLSKSQLAKALGHKSVSGKLNQWIRNMLVSKLVEYTIPDKPNSRLQQYRLTAKGREILENLP